MSRRKELIQTEQAVNELERLEEWFDNPNKSPSITLSFNQRRFTPGMILRDIRASLLNALRSGK